jgi:hypothetical protein
LAKAFVDRTTFLTGRPEIRQLLVYDVIMNIIFDLKYKVPKMRRDTMSHFLSYATWNSTIIALFINKLPRNETAVRTDRFKHDENYESETTKTEIKT